MTCDDVLDLAPSFVLGALEAEEETAVREHLATCAEPHPEFEELGSVVPALVETIDLVEPPAALRGRIMTAAARDLAERHGAPSAAAPSAAAPSAAAPSAAAPSPPVPGAAAPSAAAPSAAAPSAAAPSPPVPGAAAPSAAAPSPPVPSAAAPSAAAPTASLVTPTAASERTAPAGQIVDLTAARESRRSGRIAWLAGIAAVIAIVVLGAWNVTLNGDLNAAVAYRQHVEDVLAVAARSGSSSAILTSKDDPLRSGLAAVASDGSVHIVVRGLSANTGTTVYTAWVINSSGPIAVGSFTVGSDGLGYLATLPGPGAAGVTVALTLEPVSGNTKPAGPVVSSGVAGM